MKNSKQFFIIIDWAGNIMNFGNFKSFEDAEEYLCIKLGDSYETDRGEYHIEARGES